MTARRVEINSANRGGLKFAALDAFALPEAPGADEQLEFEAAPAADPNNGLRVTVELF